MDEIKEIPLSDGNSVTLKAMKVTRYWEIAALFRSNHDSLLLEKSLIINTITAWTFTDEAGKPLQICLVNFGEKIKTNDYLNIVSETEAINKLSPPEKNALPVLSAED